MEGDVYNIELRLQLRKGVEGNRIHRGAEARRQEYLQHQYIKDHCQSRRHLDYFSYGHMRFARAAKVQDQFQDNGRAGLEKVGQPGLHGRLPYPDRRKSQAHRLLRGRIPDHRRGVEREVLCGPKTKLTIRDDCERPRRSCREIQDGSLVRLLSGLL